MFAVALPAALGSPRLGSGTLAALAVAYVLTGNFFKETERLADTPVNFLISYMYFGALLLLWQLYRLRHAQNRAESAYPVAAKVGQPSTV
jgi:RsiW-degrading membrane proteinase PrsW (M82 family)